MDLKIRDVAVIDIMPVVTIINKLNLKELLTSLDTSKLEVKAKAANLTDEEKNDDAVALQFGLEMFMPAISVALNNLPACEKPLYSWLSNMCGMDEKEFKKLPPAAVPEALFEIVKQEGFVDFFRAVTKFLQ